MGRKPRKPLYEFPRRVCKSLHSCRLCPKPIELGQTYYDGGYGNRAHMTCVIPPPDPATDTASRAKAAALQGRP